ncbi:hypothetical protein F511_17638 [Dorcoceras hygrometricum]|uniref:Transmembrane 9 superfamily member n=1 Tax=Dorcoceras hygrometricum TaxID=472368 RepID=A0A2Z7AIS8_9LAMI|nr:hypothetical protein F511_17638 [Dorcoceras hygrometricum]
MAEMAMILLPLVLILVSPANGFYLPGVAPRDFQLGETLEVKVNKLSSTKTQLPYDYYSLSYCKPQKIINGAENLGEVLRGDRIENSVYTFNMKVPQSCKIACPVKLDASAAKNFKKKIVEDYRVNMILDNLPVAVVWQTMDGSQQKIYERGFRVGYRTNQKYFIYNHLSFKVKYHQDPDANTARVVGFEVFPLSINHKYEKWEDNMTKLTTCMPSTQSKLAILPQEIDADKEIVFTYDVSFESSDIRWASRWDTYLYMRDDQIHWFSIINSLMIVIFLSGIVAMIMMRTLYKDIVKYNQLDQEEALDETGWKLVHADVFRPPNNYSLLCVYVGTGVQVLGMAFVTIIFAMLGFLSPSNRGAIPFGTMFILVLLWFGISVPLVFLGSFLGQKTPSFDDPAKTNKIPRPIPPQPWYIHPVFSMLFGGVLPYAAVFIELFFILTSVWLNQFYYIFGFLFLAFVILFITCAEITIVLCYIQLCCEDYRWWWRAYLTSGASALYLFFYSILYFCTKLEITKLVSGILYFGYMFIISYVFFILTGTIGFCSCLWFVRKIYSSVKTD